MAIRMTAKIEPAEPIEPKPIVFSFEKPKGKPGRPASGKIRVTMLLKPDTVAKFKATGPGWQARISAVLDAAKL